MDNYELNHNKIILKNRIIPVLSLSKEEEELLYLFKKNNLANKISMTDLSLLNYNQFNRLKKNNVKYENNQKLLNQIEDMYSKIYREKPLKKQELLHNMLYNNSENDNSYSEKKNIFKKQNSIKKKLLPKLITPELSQPKNLKKKNNSRKAILLSNIYTNNEINDANEASFPNSNNNSEDKNKKCYYIIKSNKNINDNRQKGKEQLPPINKFRFKFHKLKLNINNEIDFSDQQHEDMMKMYKEIEYKNKNKFFV